MRQLREQHVVGTLSGHDELVTAVQRSTERLLEAVAYQPAASALGLVLLAVSAADSMRCVGGAERDIVCRRVGHACSATIADGRLYD